MYFNTTREKLFVTFVGTSNQRVFIPVWQWYDAHYMYPDSEGITEHPRVAKLERKLPRLKVIRVLGHPYLGGMRVWVPLARAQGHEFHAGMAMLCMVAFQMSDVRLPQFPNGQRLSLSLGSLRDCDTGGRLWSSAIVHCRWQQSLLADELKSKRVLELGCGTGAVGLFSAGLGAGRVVLTDGGSDALLALAAQNVRDNRELFPSSQVEVDRLAWGTAADFGGIDWIFAADVTYASDAQPALCWTLAEQLRLSGDRCKVVLAHEHREHAPPSEVRRVEQEEEERRPRAESLRDERLEHFETEAARAGLAVRTLCSDVQGGRRVSVLSVSRLSVACRPDSVVQPTPDAPPAGRPGRRASISMRLTADPHGDEAADESLPSQITPLPSSAFVVAVSVDPRRGQGLFARHALNEGAYLFDYTGDVLLEDSLEGQSRMISSDYVVGVINTAGVAFVVDGEDVAVASLARYMNHAEAPPACNVAVEELGAVAANMEYAAVVRARIAAAGEMVDVQALMRSLLEVPEAIPPPRLRCFALRDIEAGEELMWHYGDGYWESMAKRGRALV